MLLIGKRSVCMCVEGGGQGGAKKTRRQNYVHLTCRISQKCIKDYNVSFEKTQTQIKQLEGKMREQMLNAYTSGDASRGRWEPRLPGILLEIWGWGGKEE